MPCVREAESSFSLASKLWKIGFERISSVLSIFHESQSLGPAPCSSLLQGSIVSLLGCVYTVFVHSGHVCAASQKCDGRLPGLISVVEESRVINPSPSPIQALPRGGPPIKKR
jgi:hypothetical protein